MKYVLYTTSMRYGKEIIKEYPIINKYNPIIDHPYQNQQAERLIIDVDDLLQFYHDIGKDIIIGEDINNVDDSGTRMYYLEIHDDDYD